MSITMLASLQCLVYAILAWMAAYAAWSMSHVAATLVALVSFMALALAIVPSRGTTCPSA